MLMLSARLLGRALSSIRHAHHHNDDVSIGICRENVRQFACKSGAKELIPIGI